MRLGLNKLNEEALQDAKFVISSTNSRFSRSDNDNRSFAISGFYTNDMQLSGGNDFTSPFEDFDLAKKAIKGFNIFSSILSSKSSNGVGNIASLTKQQSMLVYSGSQKPVFNVEVLFIATDSSIRPLPIDKVKSLMRLVYPTGDSLLTAPLGYKPSINGKALQGTVSLRIGKWFHATNLVVKDANFTLSKEIIRDGSPLYATGTITLEPYRAVSYGDYMGWFKR